MNSIVDPSNPVAVRIQERIERRATHRDAEDASRTLSDWAASELVSSEYHGRFLIELLQNARDAYLERRPPEPKGVVRVRLTAEPALLVANNGVPMPENILLLSIGRFGLGTKTEGESIGYKGIGFKSVLEISMTPEIYSCRGADGFGLAVEFDPDDAVALVRQKSPTWDDLVKEVLGSADPHAAEHVPLLQYPMWVKDPEERLCGAADYDGIAFDTVIRLPYDGRSADKPGITKAEFVDKVQKAMRRLSDQMVLLLGAFERIVVEDEIENRYGTVARRDLAVRELDGGGVRRDVSVERDGDEHSRWLVFERSLADSAGLESALTVAVRVAPADGRLVVERPSAEPGDGGDTFHLFFPTRIATHLPFLLHAYFRVSANRTQFADGEKVRNEALLDGLRLLAVDAVRSLIADHEAGVVDASGLAELFAETPGPPDDELGASFRAKLLHDLDSVPWVPVIPPSADGPRFARPADLLAEAAGQLAEDLPAALPAGHVNRRLAMFYPVAELSGGAREFVRSRAAAARKGAGGLTADALRGLLLRGAPGPWADRPEAIDDGFRALARVLATLKASRSDLARVLGDPDADFAFIPVLDPDPPHRTLRGPVLNRGLLRAVPWILARVGADSEPDLAPPRSIGVDFLPDGLLDEAAIGALAFLGVREYKVDTVLDALQPERIPETAAREVARFVWRLLLRDESYSIAKVLDILGAAEPGAWYWSRPNVRTESERDDLKRARLLSHLRFPTLDGSLHPADNLVFGRAWSEWLSSGVHGGSAAFAERAAVYRDLEALAPSPAEVIAGPEVVRAYLGVPDPSSELGGTDPADQTALVHAFLVRIGVWEIPPVDSINDLSIARSDADADPWANHPLRRDHFKFLRRAGSRFLAMDHPRVLVGEDFSLRWPVSGARPMVDGLARGVALYDRCENVYLFCPKCKANKDKADNQEELQRPSLLRRQLDGQAWVPVTLAGRDEAPVRPQEAWRDDDVPEGPYLAQSALRFLRLVPRWFPRELADFVRITDIDGASLVRLKVELRWLNENLEPLVGAEPRHGSEAGRSFLSLHRRLYQRLALLAGNKAREAIDETGVLATRGTALAFAPPHEARHDKGDYSVYRKYFASAVPFVALKSDQSTLATALGVDSFQVRITRTGDDDGEPVTDAVREFLHDRMHLYFTALCYYSVGGTTMDVGSRRFRERADDFRGLTVRQVDDLRLTLTVVGTAETRTIGEGSKSDLFVDRSGTAPVIYLDFPGATWPDRFRQAAGPYLAGLLDNEGYASVFRLLLECESDRDAQALLADLGVDPDQIAEVSAALESGDRLARDEEERWWRALLPLLGIDLAVAVRDPEWHARLGTALAGAGLMGGAEDLGSLLMRYPGTEGVRTDIVERGVLAALERHGVDLKSLHQALGPNDRGLDVRGAERRLDVWRRRHGQEVVAVLWSLRVSDAAERPEGWRVPSGYAWRAVVGPEIYLMPVLEDLAEAGVTSVDAAALTDEDASANIAGLVGMSPEELLVAWRSGSSVDSAAKFAQDQGSGWLRLLLPVLVAARTQDRIGCGGYELRDETSRVRREASGISSPVDLAALLPGLVPGMRALGEALSERVASHQGLALPRQDDILAFAVAQGVDSGHLSRVNRVLLGGVREAVDRVQRDIAALRNGNVRPVKVDPGVRPPVGPESPTGSRKKVHGVKHGTVNTARIGRVGEAWARAAVLDTLLGLSPERQADVVRAMQNVAKNRLYGEPVDQVLSHASAYFAAVEDDERIDALIRFVHVSEVSDGFGFDLIGFVESDEEPDDLEAGVLFLEVKSSSGRSFEVSAPEWATAELPELSDRYAFLVVLRDDKGQPSALELLTNPASLLKNRKLSKKANSWKVSYDPPAPKST